MFLVPINSIISFLIEREGDVLKYFIASIPFVIALIIYKLFTRYKFITNSILYFFCSILCILFAPWDNITGALLLCLAIYTWNDKIIMWEFLIMTALTIAIKTIFLPEPTTRVLNYILVYAWFICLYFIKIHPRAILKHNDLDEANEGIVKALIQGYSRKEISNKVCISENAVSKRIQAMREKFSCGNDAQMVYYMIEKGFLRLK
jgi:DNA-binding CsgD family transcriptional regulator